MRDDQRSCFKCGRTPAKDPSIRLYRFPKPGVKNLHKCAMWARFIFPDKQWDTENVQLKLHSEHRMLCNIHFEAKWFVNKAENKLAQDAIPTIETMEESPTAIDINISDVTLPVPSTSSNRPDLSLEGIHETSRMEMALDKTILRDVTNLPSTSSSRPAPLESINETVGKPQKEKNKKQIAQCRKYVNKISRLKNALKKMRANHMLNVLDDDASLKKLAKKLTPSFTLMLQGQLRNHKRKPRGHRWTQEEKIIALRLYKRSPTCYRLMRRLFSLPSPSTLKNLLSKFKLKVGLNVKIFEMLEAFSKTLKNEDNHFVLMFDEMAIKKHLEYNKHEDIIEGFQDHGNHGRTREEATHALVFMLGGIRKAVKQPVAFFLSGSHVTADRLSVIIKEVVQACFKAGINIQSLVCDMDGVNYRAYKLLGATEAQPVIEISNKRVITMFDTPHLLKCFRNCFLKYDIKCPSDLNTPVPALGIAKWSHIKEFYEIDRHDAVFVHAPALSNIHLEPNTKQKMRVYLAAQVLSHSVASGMFAKIAKGALTTGAMVTATVVSNIDKLFDLVNSNTPDLKRGKPYSTNLTDTSPHGEFFEKMKFFFRNIIFLGCKRDPPSRQGWIWTLTAIELVWANIKSSEIKSLTTRRLQQDPLENYFSLIRSNYCGTNPNPTVGQFRAALKTSCLSKLPVIASGNCQQDDNEIILDNFKKLLTPCHSDPLPIEEASQILVEINEENATNDDMEACAYVCGFVIKRLASACTTCKHILNASEEEEMHIFVSFKEYSDKNQSLRYASRPLVECVQQSGKIIVQFLDTNSHETNLKKHIQSLLLREVSFDFLKKCEEHFAHVRLFIIESVFYILIKRFCILKNRKYAEDAHQIALKKKINILKHT